MEKLEVCNNNKEPQKKSITKPVENQKSTSNNKLTVLNKRGQVFNISNIIDGINMKHINKILYHFIIHK